MPIVRIEYFEGRSIEQKRELVARITRDVSEVLRCPAEAVKVIIREMRREDFAEGGKLFSDL